MTKILVTEDDAVQREIVTDILLRAGYEVTAAAGGNDALNALEHDDFALLLTDMRMPEMDGLDLLRRAKGLRPDTEVIMMTAHATVETAITAMKEGKSQTDFPVALHLEEDNVLVFAANSSPILDSNFNLRGAMATFNDETALQEANGVLLEMMDKLRKSQDEVNKQNTELKRLATRDPMTNCLNRRSFFERMEKAFTLAQSEKNPLGRVMVDIDHFKKINDEHGHGIGDKVLKMVAKLLESKFGNKDSICRYGGEEFCVLLPGTGLDKAIEIAQEVRSTIESYATMGIETKGPLTVTASIGVAAIEQGATEPGKLVDQADKALYQAKETGRNRVEQWSPALADNRAA